MLKILEMGARDQIAYLSQNLDFEISEEDKVFLDI